SSDQSPKRRRKPSRSNGVNGRASPCSSTSRSRGIQSTSSLSVRWATTSSGLYVPSPSRALNQGTESPSSQRSSSAGVRDSTSIASSTSGAGAKVGSNG